jgi:hypothetical protein
MDKEEPTIAVENEKIVTPFSSLEPDSLLKYLFDNPTIIDSTGEAKWKPNYSEQQNVYVSQDGFCYTEVDTIIYHEYMHDDYATVVLATHWYNASGNRLSCHSCGVTLGVVYLTLNKDSKWALLGFNKSIGECGSWGSFNGTISVNQLCKSLCALVIRSGIHGNHGYTSGYETWYDLSRPSRFNEMIKYRYHDSNEGAIGSSGYTEEKTVELKSSGEDCYLEMTTTRNNPQTLDTRTYTIDEWYGINF